MRDFWRNTVTEHTYSYDQDIQSDSEMMEVYSELARETRWKQFAHTEIERIWPQTPAAISPRWIHGRSPRL